MNSGDQLTLFLALEKLRGTRNVDEEMKEMEGDGAGKEGKWTLMRVLRTRELWLPLMLACSVNLSQQITCLDEVMYYAEQLFKQWNLGEYFVTWSLMVISIVNSVVSALAVFQNIFNIHRYLLLIFSDIYFCFHWLSSFTIIILLAWSLYADIPFICC